MKKIIIYSFIALGFLSLTELRAQETVRAGLVDARDIVVERTGGNLKITANLSANTLGFDPQMMLTVTPVLVHESETVFFEPVTLVGRKRRKAFERQRAFGNQEAGNLSGEVLVLDRHAASWNCPLVLETAYQDWMSDAKLVLHEDISGCAKWDGEQAKREYSPLLERPVYALTYLEPQVEAVKQRSETHSAYINYVVARYELLPNFRNNAQVLGEVDRIVSELRNDPNLTITELSIVGYASPEGGYDSNMKLSENRAKSFVNYLRNKYAGQIPSDIMTVSWKGEDWDGLRKQVETSNRADKQEILRVLDEPDNSVRKTRLRQLAGGRTYTELLADYYPVLRRNEYTIAYVSKAFSVQEAREIIKTRPQYLSLNEMYHVANSYPKDSREFRETMDVIWKYYPNDEIALLNEAVAQVETGDYSGAIPKLLRIERPEAWNALGVAYYGQGDEAKAREYFTKAAESGLSAGVQNADAYRKSMYNRL